MVRYKTIKKIAEQLLQKEFDYDYVGIRIQEEKTEKIGEIMAHKSYVWDDGEMTDERLNGVCAVDIKQAKALFDFGGYDGDYIYILGCYHASNGEDAGEIIMTDPIVLDIIEVEEDA